MLKIFVEISLSQILEQRLNILTPNKALTFHHEVKSSSQEIKIKTVQNRKKPLVSLIQWPRRYLSKISTFALFSKRFFHSSVQSQVPTLVICEFHRTLAANL